MIDLSQYGLYETAPLEEVMIYARVTEVQREIYTVITTYGELTAVLKGSFYYNALEREDFPCVGDFVKLEYNPSGVSRIAELLPRTSKFSRADFMGHGAGYAKTIKEQLVAANFDYVFIVSSLNYDFNVKRILRYITQTNHSGGKAVVILAKADLRDDLNEPLNAVRNALPDTPVHCVSSHTRYGLAELEQYLQPSKTVVFLGMSGVGKSSLLNALMEREVMAVKQIREDDSKGRHTTTHRQLFVLPSGAMVIDTPGMREIGLYDSQESVSSGYTDIEELFTQCRFSNCGHTTEPGCAVLAALESGELTQDRWDGYHAQIRESKFAEDKAAYARERARIHKDYQKILKPRGKKKGTRDYD